ncbi:amino acid transporter [Desulfuromonas versatilis]|uniref:Amino acid transporter n=1 Tax=Desulfuromonas versatilis TaxID=2802975 RepID=A0ABM8HUZ2_9BACT|nr:LysE/ArgO family amino acid transporter [Desulfuromonas versatilis]BCR04323.1 amino acid transporter [Desulfuromonas versatilis]
MHPTLSLAPLLQGFTLSASLIIAIGSQNAFVLRQGLRREHVFVVCTICFFCDAALIALGVAGFGSLVASSPLLLRFTYWAGAAFLFAYGLRAFRAALKPGSLAVDVSGTLAAGLGRVALTTLVLTLLNPHVYIDTVLLLGSVAGQQAAGARPWFAIGAVCASLLWFYSLGYGARVLAPLFRKPSAWRALDGLIGCVMWAIAASLVWPLLVGAG